MKLKAIHAALCLLMAAALFTTACSSGSSQQTTDNVGSSDPAQSQNTSSSTDGAEGGGSDTTPGTSEKTITLQCGSKSASGEGSVELSAAREFSAGKEITVTLPEGQHYLAFNLCKNTLKEAILYVPGNQFTYIIPNISISYPAMSRATITARIPEESELTASHNLALNPTDLIDPDMKITGYSYNAYWAGNAFPHVTTSSVCRYSADETSKYQFEGRNAIDGFTQNNGHGNYPVQSWGPDSDFSTVRGYITVDFGHEIKADSLNLYIRADFPHDTYFTSAEIVFSDGSTQTIELTNSANVQSFDLGGKTTSSIKLTKMAKNDASGWAGLMEIEVIGSEILG